MIFSDVIEIETAVVLIVTLARISALKQELCISEKLKMLYLTFFDLSRNQLLYEFSTDLQSKLNSWI